jgi:hypothetical protein
MPEITEREIREESARLMGWVIDNDGFLYSVSENPLPIMSFDEWNPILKMNQCFQCQNKIMELGLVDQYFKSLKEIITIDLEDYSLSAKMMESMFMRSTLKQSCLAMVNTYRIGE